MGGEEDIRGLKNKTGWFSISQAAQSIPSIPERTDFDILTTA